MRKVFYIAKRDFIATVTTRAFLITLLFPVAMFAFFSSVLPRLMRRPTTPSAVTGRVAVIDPTGQITPELQEYLSEDQMMARERAARQRALGDASPLAQGAVDVSDVDVPHLLVIALPSTANLDAEKDVLKSSRRSERIALVVIQGNAVKSDHGDDRYGTYQVYVQRFVDSREQSEILDGVQHAIVVARARAEGLDPSHIAALMTVIRPRAVTVTSDSETDAGGDFSRAVPFVLVILLLMSVMTSGQQLLTTTVEEKASRTIEVLLAAVSPMQLMAGKILGHMAVGLLVLSIYSSVGAMALVAMTMMGFVDPKLVIYLFVFFLLTYLLIGSLTAAIGAAVNEFRQAQGLMMPVTLLIMVPWLLIQPIMRDPSSTLARAATLIPPFSSFAILIRVASGAPPAPWEIAVAIGVAVIAAATAMWFAARVFRVGLLMYGAPPDFATLIKWARQG